MIGKYKDLYQLQDLEGIFEEFPKQFCKAF
jgi:hypothetical protein